MIFQNSKIYGFLSVIFILANILMAHPATAEVRPQKAPPSMIQNKPRVDPATCPPADSIPNCQCTVSSNGIDILASCNGVNVTQVTLNEFFASIRSFNNLSTTDWIYIPWFSMDDTNLVEIDVTPFLYTEVDNFFFNRDRQLFKITRPPTSLPGDIVVSTFQSSVTALDDHSMVDFLYLVGPTIYSVGVSNADIRGIPQGEDFIDGLTSSTREVMDTLFFDGNKITRVGGGQFRKFDQLRYLVLSYNHIVEIGEDAFLFDNNTAAGEGTEEEFIIELEFNMLDDNSFSPLNGLESIRRETWVKLAYNNFVTLSAENFENFLYAHPLNRLQFDSFGFANYFICDERMKWLKDAREELENRVTGVDCSNDPGKTIFTTDLV